MNDPAPQSSRPQRQRRLCHTSLTGLPNAGRSTNSTCRSPLDHNDSPQPEHRGLSARLRTCTLNAAVPLSSTPSTSTSPSPTINSHILVGSYSTGILQRSVAFDSTDSGGSPAINRGYPQPLLHPHFRRTSLRDVEQAVHQTVVALASLAPPPNPRHPLLESE